MVFKYAWLPHTLTLTQFVDRVTFVHSRRLILTFVVCPDGQRWLYIDRCGIMD
jgi:hypothetical protein